MASRFWVGGTNTWNATATGKWSTISGGASGAATPTATDDVFFDSLSTGTVTIDLSGTQTCLSLNATGFTGTITLAASSVLTVAGNLTSGSGTIWTTAGGIININGASTITSNGASLVGISQIAHAAITLGDDLNIPISGNVVSIDMTDGTFNANNHNVTVRDIRGTASIAINITMGSGTWTFLGDDGHSSSSTFGVWNIRNRGTVNAGTSTIKLTSTAANALTISGVDDLGASTTFNNIWFARGASTQDIIMNTNNCTFANIKDTGTAAHNMYFPASSNTTFSTFNVSGTPGNLITLTTTLGSTASHTLTCTTGIISCDYLAISHSVATGGATFYAGANSTNNQGVATIGSGWIFTAPPGGSSHLLSSTGVGR